MMTELRINGVSHTIDTDPQIPLLWAIRDGIEGTHSAGPAWKCATDGSTVKGKKMREHASPMPAKAIPLLLLQATDHDGAGNAGQHNGICPPEMVLVPDGCLDAENRGQQPGNGHPHGTGAPHSRAAATSAQARA